MTNVTCELVWIRNLLSELHLLPSFRMRLYYDNNVAIHIEENLLFHERTSTLRWIVILTVRRLLRITLLNYNRFPLLVSSMLTKPLEGLQIRSICDKMGMYDVYAPIWGSVKKYE